MKSIVPACDDPANSSTPISRHPLGIRSSSLVPFASSGGVMYRSNGERGQATYTANTATESKTKSQPSLPRQRVARFGRSCSSVGISVMESTSSRLTSAPASVHLQSQNPVQVGGAMDTAMMGLGVHGQQAVDLANTARSTSRLGKEVFNDEIIGQVMGKMAPEEAARLLFQNASPTRVEKVMQILDNPKFAAAIGNPKQVKGALRGAYLDTLSTRAGQGPMEFGALSGKRLLTALRTSGGTVQALFPSFAEQRALAIAGRALEMTQAKAGGSGAGTIYVGLKQASAMGQAAAAPLAFLGFGGKGALGGAAILGIPALIAEVMSKDSMARLLLDWAEGKSARVGRTSGEMVAQLASRMISEGIGPFQVRDEQGQIHEVPAGMKLNRGSSDLKPRSKF